MGRLARLLTPLALCLTLASCYLPDDYLAELQIGRDGTFRFEFKGELIRVPLFKEIKEGQLTRDEIKEKIELIERDLTMGDMHADREEDKRFKSITSLGMGRFRVHYVTRGSLVDRYNAGRLVAQGNPFFAFVRRNAVIFSVRTDETGEVHVSSHGLSTQQRGQILELGLNSQGKLRVVTDAEVVAHNAQSISQHAPPFMTFKIFDWEFRNLFSPAPRMILKLALDPRPKPPQGN